MGNRIALNPNEQTLTLNLPQINSPKCQPQRYVGFPDSNRVKMYARKDSVDSLGSTGEIVTGVSMKTSRDNNAT